MKNASKSAREITDLQETLQDVASVIKLQVSRLKAKIGQGKELDRDEAKLLNSFARTLCVLAAEERSSVKSSTSELANMSDAELERLAREAEEVVGKK